MKHITYIKHSVLIVLLTWIGIFSATAQKKCLIVSVDGLTPFAIRSSHTPNIDALMDNGTYTLEGQTLAPTLDASGWTSLLTGVWYTKHKVTTESMQNYDVNETTDRLQIVVTEKGMKVAARIDHQANAEKVEKE